MTATAVRAPMDRVTRTNKQIIDIEGTITSTDGLHIDVRFDLVEMEDLINGILASRFSYGVLRYPEPLEPAMKSRLLFASHLTLTGGGIEAALCLYKLNTFTLVDTIHEFPFASRFTKAVDLVAA
jgi:hypothetical protein